MITRSKDREEDKILGPDDKVGEMGSFKKKTYEKKFKAHVFYLDLYCCDKDCGLWQLRVRIHFPYSL